MNVSDNITAHLTFQNDKTSSKNTRQLENLSALDPTSTICFLTSVLCTRSSQVFFQDVGAGFDGILTYDLKDWTVTQTTVMI